jgi:hypothetical protein
MLFADMNRLSISARIRTARSSDAGRIPAGSRIPFGYHVGAGFWGTSFVPGRHWRYFRLPGKPACCYEFSAGAVAAGSVAATHAGL